MDMNPTITQAQAVQACRLAREMKADAAAPAAQQATARDPDDVSEVIALARSAGLKGFADRSNTSTGTQLEAAARRDPDDPDDGSDVLALVGRYGLGGFGDVSA